MVAGEDRLLRLLARGGVLLSEDLGIVLDDPGETLGGQNPPPQVVRHDPVRVGRVARAIVVSLVKRQEPRRGALQLGTELHPLVIDCKVRERTPEGEQQLLRVAVPLVLLHGIIDSLLRDVVLQLEREHGDAIHERHKIHGIAAVARTVMHLPGDHEAVSRKQLRGPRVTCARLRVVEVHVLAEVIHTAPKDVHHPTLRDLTLQAGQEPVTGRRLITQRQRLRDAGLGRLDERRQMFEIESIGRIEIGRAAFAPASFHHLSNDERFEAGLVEAWGDHCAAFVSSHTSLTRSFWPHAKSCVARCAWPRTMLGAMPSSAARSRTAAMFRPLGSRSW